MLYLTTKRVFDHFGGSIFPVAPRVTILPVLISPTFASTFDLQAFPLFWILNVFRCHIASFKQA